MTSNRAVCHEVRLRLSTKKSAKFVVDAEALIIGEGKQ